MKTKLHSTFSILHSAFVLVAAFALFTTAPRAPAQTGAGFALSFDGTNDYVSLPYPVSLNAYPLTITTWIKTTQTAGNPPGLVNKYVSGSGNGYQLFLFHGEAHAWYFRDPANRVYDPNDEGLNGGFVADGQWHHLAFAVDASGGRLYVDGSLRCTQPWTDEGGGPGAPGPATTHQELSFARYPSDPPTLSGYFNGVIDEVTLWNVALGEEEIQNRMHVPLTGSEPGLRGCWHLNEGTNNMVLDVAPLHSHGDLVNGPVWVVSTAPLHPGPPWVITLSATYPTRTKATLLGTVNPIGSETMAWFEWGATTNYGNSIGLTNLGSGSSRISLSHELTSLASGITYHCRLTASNAFGLVWGRDETFTTVPPALVTTLPATDFTLNGAALQGTVNPMGAETLVWFEWGTNVSYGFSIGLTHVGSGTDLVPVSEVLTGLVVGISYHYRLAASNEFGLAWGNDQIFTPLFTDIEAGLPGVWSSSVAWGDDDNDGDLDILLTGFGFPDRISCVYRNDGGMFTNLTVVLPEGVSDGSAAWGDYDNDGDLDILLTGVSVVSDSGLISRVYRNDGGMFTNINAGLPEVAYSSVAWGDYDNDGDLDMLLAGFVGEDTNAHFVLIADVYRNDGGMFTNVNAGLPGVIGGCVAWGDYDNDGDLDILLTGDAGTNWYEIVPISRIYRNDGGMFTNINAGLTGVQMGSAAWGDYDNDGDLDILLTGWNGSADISCVYRNDGGMFTNINAGLTGVEMGSAAWGDYDNDGDLDILLTGSDTNGTLLSRVYRNDSGTFTDINAGLPGVSFHSYGSVAWGDYDNDGDLDILITGEGDFDLMSRIYRNNLGNNIPVSNTPPAPPTGLRAEGIGDHVTLRWHSATDAQTPSAALTYNVRLGTTPGGGDIVSPQAGANGFRRVPAMGNGQLGATFRVKLPLDRSLYWSVQAVDTAFAGSPFATEASFRVNGLLSSPTGLVRGDFNGDGLVDQAELDAVLTHYWPTSPWLCITNTAGLGGTNVTFALPHATAAAFSVLMSTNLADWEYLGPATPRYEFIDTNTPAEPQRYYRLRWP